SAQDGSAQDGSAPGSRRKFINYRVGDSPYLNDVNALIFDSQNTLWCATDGGLLRASAGQESELKFELVAPHRRVSLAMAAFADRRGGLWFGIEDGLVGVIQGQIIKDGREDGIGRHPILSIVEDRQGHLLVASGSEVFEFIEPADGKGRGR